jgi:putative membrane protein
LATIAGIGIAIWTIGWVGFEPVMKAVTRLGMGGFLALCVYNLGLLGVLGLAWWVVAPGVPAARSPIFMWGRTTREAASDVLPFSQLGGLVVGGRTVTGFGIPSSLTYASMIADLTTEMAAQLVVTVFGVAALFLAIGGNVQHNAILHLSFLGLGLAVLILLAFSIFQRPMLKFASKLSSTMLPGAVAATDDVRDRLGWIYGHPGRVGASFLLNLLGWVASGVSAWIALRLMGVEITPGRVMVIESLIFALRGIAFMIPGAIGLQEGAYVLLGPVFGLDPSIALALSLFKRARDIAIGIPALIVWQIGEGRSLIPHRRAPGA